MSKANSANSQKGIAYKVLTGIWAVWGGFWYLIVLAIFAPFIFIAFLFSKSAKANILYIRIGLRWISLWLYLVGIRCKISGKEFLDKNKTYVMVANHTSSLDIPAYMKGAYPVAFRFLAKAELGKVPVMGFLLKRLAVLVDRKNVEARKQSFQNMVNSINEGISVGIYPEGTRNKTQEPLKQFYNGAFRLAIETNTPIAVLTIVGASELMGKYGSASLRPGTYYAYWSKPIDTSNYQMSDIEQLMDEVRQTMLSKLQSHPK